MQRGAAEQTNVQSQRQRLGVIKITRQLVSYVVERRVRRKLDLRKSRDAGRHGQALSVSWERRFELGTGHRYPKEVPGERIANLGVPG